MSSKKNFTHFDTIRDFIFASIKKNRPDGSLKNIKGLSEEILIDYEQAKLDKVFGELNASKIAFQLNDKWKKILTVNYLKNSVGDLAEEIVKVKDLYKKIKASERLEKKKESEKEVVEDIKITRKDLFQELKQSFNSDTYTTPEQEFFGETDITIRAGFHRVKYTEELSQKDKDKIVRSINNYFQRVIKSNIELTSATGVHIILGPDLITRKKTRETSTKQLLSNIKSTLEFSDILLSNLLNLKKYFTNVSVSITHELNEDYSEAKINGIFSDYNYLIGELLSDYIKVQLVKDEQIDDLDEHSIFDEEDTLSSKDVLILKKAPSTQILKDKLFTIIESGTRELITFGNLEGKYRNHGLHIVTIGSFKGINSPRLFLSDDDTYIV